MSNLSRLHPYPAMIADGLADDLAQRFIAPGARVLDPFCGTGRLLLAAAATGSHCVGIDVNPLAVLITRAKAGSPNLGILQALLRDLDSLLPTLEDLELTPGRRVVWLGAKARRDLCSLIHLINDSHIRGATLEFVATVLSATVREVSLARKDSWKLHRIPSRDRRHFRKSAVKVFRRRLQSALSQVRWSNMGAAVRVVRADAIALTQSLRRIGEDRPFDVICCSPPYGDSVSTVQYGGMSGLCLGVLRHLTGLRIQPLSSNQIDLACVGGRRTLRRSTDRYELRRYWSGAKSSEASERVARFVYGIAECCEQMSANLSSKGTVILVLGRRIVRH